MNPEDWAAISRIPAHQDTRPEYLTGICVFCELPITSSAPRLDYWVHDHNSSPACKYRGGQKASPKRDDA